MSGIILVRDIMAKNVKTVRTDDSAHDAVVKMNKFVLIGEPEPGFFHHLSESGIF
jgi:CBS domain-containing protein